MAGNTESQATSNVSRHGRVQQTVTRRWRRCIIAFVLVGTRESRFSAALVPRQQRPPPKRNAENGSHWQIHRTIQQLQTRGMPRPRPPADPSKIATVVRADLTSTAAAVVTVLESWARNCAGKEEWRSLLNKRSLRHEVEESIVALHHLREWREQPQQQEAVSAAAGNRSRSCDEGFIAVDACCGKGVFSMLLSYLAAAPESHIQPHENPWCAGLSRIILLDKNQEINWDHIQAANANHQQEARPFLELWRGTNLHEHDSITERLLRASSGAVGDATKTTEIRIHSDSMKDAESTAPAASIPLAITGIHLCKTLSPALVGIVNALGKEKVPYLCLAPCCLPKTRDQRLSVPLYEPPPQRRARLRALREKRRQRDDFACFVCGGSDHHVRSCPQRVAYPTEAEWDRAVTAGILRLKVPCGRCGRAGHRRRDCTADGEAGTSRARHEERPRMLWDFGSVVAATPENQQPFEAYCEALSKLVQQTSTVDVTDSGLVSSASMSPNNEVHKQVNNWNQNRKSLFITAIR